LQQQRAFFNSGATLDVDFRIHALKQLRDAVYLHEDEIKAALKADLGKSDMESFMCEVGLTLCELSYMLRHIRCFAREHSVYSPITLFASTSYRKPSPYGSVLIMSPWNYPFLLTIDPLIDAIAAGNTVVLKPSDYSPATSEIMARIIEECFPPQYVAVVRGGRKENAGLLSTAFDFVFFTGSQNVGKEVLRHCAERLTPAVLELGGKSPCIVDSSAKIDLAARRIVWGKFLNLGQTCVAPDYILCHESVRDELLWALKREIARQFGANPLANPDYGHIVNDKHFHRLLGLIDLQKVVVGGGVNAETLQIAPTVMGDVTWEDAVMGEEIFGPILPVLTFANIDDVIGMLADKQKPLAFYVFAEDRAVVSKLMSKCRFGGGCVNDVVIHLATSNMPFGGVGDSGMGAYHGKVGFDTFSHTKSIVDKATWVDVPMRYQPFNRAIYGRMMRLFLR
jgi:aldehyde dehydrogenase (NAD+)